MRSCHYIYSIPPAHVMSRLWPWHILTATRCLVLRKTSTNRSSAAQKRSFTPFLRIDPAEISCKFSFSSRKPLFTALDSIISLKTSSGVLHTFVIYKAYHSRPMVYRSILSRRGIGNSCGVESRYHHSNAGFPGDSISLPRTPRLYPERLQSRPSLEGHESNRASR